MKRRNLVGCAAAAFVALAAASATGLPKPGQAAPSAARQPPAASARPNILFVLVDDMGFADLSLTGNRKVGTPNIDRLAREGLVMMQFYDAAPICSASRAGFFTGRFPAQHAFTTFIATRQRNAQIGQADWLDPNLNNVARMLKGAGYATGHFGKWHLGGGRDVGDAPLPKAYGFDESYTQFEGLGPRVLPSDLDSGLARQSARLGKGPVDWLPRAQITGRYVDRTLSFIQRHRAAPWFAQLWLDDVHSPWAPSPEQIASVKGKGRNEEEDRFLAVLVAMDREIGRLLQGLDSAGETNETVIVFTSDNGPTGNATKPGSADPYRGRKGSLYEGGIRQPLIVRWPGRVRAGTRDDGSVGHGVDLLPTFARIAGVAQLPASDGIDLSAVWSGTPTASRPDLFSHIARPANEVRQGPPYSIRSGPWKLLAYADGSQAELYDVQADPSERDNRVAQEPEVARRLSGRLLAWIGTIPKRRTGSNGPVRAEDGE